MISEELIGILVSLCSSLVKDTPQISRESWHRNSISIFDENHVFIDREYELKAQTEYSYCEEEVLVQADEQPRRSVCESLFRSCKANIGLVLAAIFVSSFFAVGTVFVDLNTTDSCIEWMQKNFTVPPHVKTLQMIGMSMKLLPLILLFPVCIAMLWGCKNFKQNYLPCLCLCQVVTGSLNCAYRIFMFQKFEITSVSYNIYR